MWQKLTNLYQRFETWTNSWAPKAKTKIVAGAGVVGTTAGLLQSYISGLPLDHYISTETVLITNAVLFTLAYWFRGLGDRIEARAITNA